MPVQAYRPAAEAQPSVACPYLGLREDTATRCVFASQSHRCYRDKHPRTVPLERQVSLCLSSRYDQCPVWSGARPSVPHARRRWPLRALAIVAASALVGGAVAAVVRLQVEAVATSAPEPVQAATAPVNVTATPAAITTPAPAAVMPAAVATRPPVRYRVRAGDNLTEVAAFFGARVEDVIRVNSLPASGAIVTGQELIIPQAP